MKIITTGKSIKELLKEYGIGSQGFYPQDWYKNEKFFTENPEAGEFDIVITRKLTSLTWKEQIKSLRKDEIILHPAQYIEAILYYFKMTGQRLFEDWYIRTNVLDSDGSRVFVGDFASDGLRVSYCWDDDRHDGIGLSAARKLSSKPRKLKTSDLLTLDSFLSDLESLIKRYRK